jgi:hypothetical protein
MQVGNQMPLPGTVRNIGLEGAFIGSDCGSFSKGDFLRISLRVPEGGSIEEAKSAAYRLVGVVAHSSDAGIGVMFMSFPLGLFRSLKQLLYDDHGFSPEAPLFAEVQRDASVKVR